MPFTFTDVVLEGLIILQISFNLPDIFLNVTSSLIVHRQLVIHVYHAVVINHNVCSVPV